jgi:hypothetical protein
MTMSIAIPVGLYMFLNQAGDPQAPRVTAQPSPDIVPRGVESTRPKIKAAPSVAVSASASASAKPKRR